MKKIVLFFILLCGLIGQTKKNQNNSFLVNNESISLFSFNGLTMIDLNQPGESFEKLNKLGKPENTSYEESIVEKNWTYEYPGMKLVYVDLGGSTELLEMNITDLRSNLSISFKGKTIDEKWLLQEINKSKVEKNDTFHVERNSFFNRIKVAINGRMGFSVQNKLLIHAKSDTLINNLKSEKMTFENLLGLGLARIESNQSGNLEAKFNHFFRTDKEMLEVFEYLRKLHKYLG